MVHAQKNHKENEVVFLAADASLGEAKELLWFAGCFSKVLEAGSEAETEWGGNREMVGKNKGGNEEKRGREGGGKKKGGRRREELRD